MNQDQTQDQNENQNGEELPTNKFIELLAQFRETANLVPEKFKITKENLSMKRKETLVNTNIGQDVFPWPGKMTHIAARDPATGALISVSTNLHLTYIPNMGFGLVFTFDMLLPFFAGVYVPAPYRATDEQKKLFDSSMPGASEDVKQGLKDLLRFHITSVFPGKGQLKAIVSNMGAKENYTNSFGEFMAQATFISGSCVFLPDFTKEEKMAVTTILQEGSRTYLMESIREKLPKEDASYMSNPSEAKH